MKLQRLLDALSRLQQRHALLLFLALGAALLTADALRQRPTALQAPADTVADARAAAQWLEEEVLYREALARGLDEGDLIVRRRLVQKMRLLLETGVDVSEPDEAALRAWIGVHPGRYGGLTQLSLDHVFLSRGLRDANLSAAAASLAARLQQERRPELAALSDPHPGGTQLKHVAARDLERLFGSALATRITELPEGEWQGPLPSALGLHFVRVFEREARVPNYADVRERAQRDYLLERRRELTRLALENLKSSYGLAPASGVQ